MDEKMDIAALQTWSGLEQADQHKPIRDKALPGRTLASYC